MSERPDSPLGRSPLLLFFLLLLAYGLLLQAQPYGDGITYLSFLKARDFNAHHLLYLPALYTVTRPLIWLGLMEERTAAFFFSALSMAGGSALLHHLLRSSRSLAPRAHRPILPPLLVASSPVVVFFGTQVENHAHHFFWVCFFLLVLDRALARKQRFSLLLPGFALVPVYSSHSSILLLLPTLLLLVHLHQGGGLLRIPGKKDLLGWLLLLLPLLLMKLWFEGWIKSWISGDPNMAKDQSLAFARSLMDWRSLEWWLGFLGGELLGSAFALWLACALVLRRARGSALPLLLGLLAYTLWFGHWPVREHGAYYLAVLPLGALLLGRFPLRGRVHFCLLLLLLGLQASLSVHKARTWVEREVDPPWEQARVLHERLGPRVTILCDHGVLAYHLQLDWKIGAYAMDYWKTILQPNIEKDPERFERFASEDVPGKILEHLEKGPVFLTLGGRRFMERDPQMVRILREIEKRFRLVEEEDPPGFFVRAHR